MGQRGLIPDEPVPLERVAEFFPTLRRSLAGTFDDCALSAYFDIRYANGWSTTRQARGTILHRTYAEILRTMQRQGHRTIPPSEAIEILIEICRQQDVAPEDIVRVPLRQMPELRMSVRKFAADNEFSTHRIVDVEKRLEATVRYPNPMGGVIERRITGQLDVLLFDPPDGAIVIDWKTGFGLPPEQRDEPRGFDDEELKGLSFEGYFWQRWYGYLVMKNFGNINRMVLREFWPYATQVRRATLYRHQLPDVEAELATVVHAFDSAIAQGSPAALLNTDENGTVDIDALGWWKPSPGWACSLCTHPAACPIPEDVRVAAGAAPSSPESAERWAARLQIAERIRQAARDGLKGYVELGGAPVPVKWSKGRRVIGWYRTPRGRRFGLYTPADSDRAGATDVDAQLVEAMRESTARARAERGVQPRRRGTRRRTRA